MRKISTEAFVFGIIILLLSSATVSSSISATQAQTPEASSEELKTLSTPDPTKITQAIEMVNEELLRGFLENLTSFGPRVTGTYGCEKAAEYLFEQLNGMGLETRHHAWTSSNNKLLRLRFYKSENVEGIINGKDPTKEVLIFNGHYDTVEVSPGANDDGSAIAAILTAAYVLSNFEFNRTIKFVAFSGEEQGLLGSGAYVKETYENNEKILTEFNADGIGYSETAEGGKKVSLSYTNDADWIVNKIKEVNDNQGIGFNIRLAWIMRPGGVLRISDFYDFVLYGYKAVSFWQSEANVAYFHTAEDTIEHVNFSYLTNVTKLIVGSLAYFADMENEHPQVKIVSPRRGSLYLEDRVIKVFKHEKTLVIDDVLINADVTPGNASIEKVEFYYNGKLKYTDTEAPYQWRLNQLSLLRHKIKVIAYDELGRTSTDEMKIFFINLNKRR